PESRPRRRFVECDVDGDGEVLQMRVPSETGAWRLSDEDDRLLVPRKPWDREGPFYDLYAEGRFSDEAADDPRRPVDGDPHGLDFNRNFPYRWQPEQRQSGAGDYPTSEPEVRAVVDFLTDHRNVFGAISLHTLSGVLLRPFSDRPDAELPDFDRAVYEELGERCEERTGYESASAYHEFRAEGEEPIRGAFDDWAYNDLGIQAFTFELWSPWREAGLDFTGEYPRFFRHRSEEENLALLTWNDDELDGEAFVDWRSFDHPQLGRVEIGGWRRLYSLRNAPPSLLGERADRASAFVIDHARSGPDPRLSLEAERLEGELWRVRARLENHGYLPTDATRRARNQSADPPLHLELESPDGLELVEGEAHRRTHHLDGYANVNRPDRSAFTWRGETREHVDRHTWLLRGEGAVRVVWRGEGIGELEASVDLTPES
ncbi:MAG: M14 family zinc carboxypeptidase, partial [Bradymonadaceae bacterium]